jgi:hypothetical protein
MPRVAKFELRVLVGGVALEEYTTAAEETYVETVRPRQRARGLRQQRAARPARRVAQRAAAPAARIQALRCAS